MHPAVAKGGAAATPEAVMLKKLFRVRRSVLTVAAALLFGASISEASTIIYSTIGPGDAYLRGSGWTIGGPAVMAQGLQFTPTESGVVQTIEIAAFQLEGGASLNVSLATDAGNRPGSVFETVPICCFGYVPSIGLGNSVLRSLLTGGTRYWLLVTPVADGDHFGWSRNFDIITWFNAQQSMGGPWHISSDWQGMMRIRGDVPTPTRPTSWGRVKSLYR